MGKLLNKKLLMITQEYQVGYNIASGSTVLVASGNAMIHTLSFPKATGGLVYLTTGDQATVKMIFPIGSIGSIRLDAIQPAGFAIGCMSADAYIVTYKTP